MTAQVGEVEVTEKPTFIGFVNDDNKIPPMLVQQNTDIGRQYILFYFDGNNTDISNVKAIPFYGSDEDLERVYGYFKSGFENEDIRTFDLGKVEVRLSRLGPSNTLDIDVTHQDGESSFFSLTRNELDNLFGKD